MARDTTSSQGQTWTTRRLLAWTSQYLGGKGVDSPRLAAEMLLSHILGVERLKLYTDPDRPATDLERAAFKDLIERAAMHEPVDYLVGKAPFFAMSFTVNPAVLIPRPSTETLVEHIVQHSRRTPGFHSPLVADVGTGCGAIAVALAKHASGSRVIASDISQEALEIARENAAAHGVSETIEFVHGDLLEPIKQSGRRVRYLAANPPYISDDEWREVPPNVKNYEPVTALRGGVDGLRFIRPLIAGARDVLDAPGQLVLEIAASQKDTVLKLAAAADLSNPHVLADHEGLPRVLVAELT